MIIDVLLWGVGIGVLGFGLIKAVGYAIHWFDGTTLEESLEEKRPNDS